MEDSKLRHPPFSILYPRLFRKSCRNYGSMIVCPACTRLGSIVGLAAAISFHLLPLPYFACAIDQSDSPFLTLYLVFADAADALPADGLRGRAARRPG